MKIHKKDLKWNYIFNPVNVFVQFHKHKYLYNLEYYTYIIEKL